MRGTAVLLTWILLGSVTISRCQGLTCRSVRHMPPQHVATFATAAACGTHRRALEQHPLPTLSSANRPDMTITQAITYRCEPGGPL